MSKHLISTAAAPLLAMACVLPGFSFAARDLSSVEREGGFAVQGRVFCDTCRVGFKTPASTYVKGAKVRVECRSQTTGATTCSSEGFTDHTGTYNIQVANEHEHEVCEAVLFSSPESGCKTVLEGRERTPVFLTHNNGIASDTRFARLCPAAQNLRANLTFCENVG